VGANLIPLRRPALPCDVLAKELVTIANAHYTYSDMTGGGLLNAVIPK